MFLSKKQTTNQFVDVKVPKVRELYERYGKQNLEGEYSGDEVAPVVTPRKADVTGEIMRNAHNYESEFSETENE